MGHITDKGHSRHFFKQPGKGGQAHLGERRAQVQGDRLGVMRTDKIENRFEPGRSRLLSNKL